MAEQFFDGRLRPAYELVAAFGFLGAGLVSGLAPQSVLPIVPSLARAGAIIFLGLGFWRALAAARIVRYRRDLRDAPRFTLAASAMPWSARQLYLGLGFSFDQRHAQRLIEAREPQARALLADSRFYLAARAVERAAEHIALLRPIAALTRQDSPWNPVRPRPPIGGDPAVHGVGVEDEAPVWQDIGERVGHTLVLGTTRVGKTRLAEMLLAQDIRRGETVIVLDPKGDVDLLRRTHAECARAGRLDRLHIFHLGFPEISERYNPVGEFGRITEVASRLAAQLPSEGNSAAFREFAWRFTNIVARALVGLGRKPDLRAIARFVTNIEPLLIDYFTLWLDREGPQDWRQAVQRMEADEDFGKRLPQAMKSRDRHACALALFYKERQLYDPVCDGLRSAFEYDKTYFDKLTASLLPLLEKLTSGPTGELLAPDYLDLADRRPILDWMKVIRENAVVYVGLDALTDGEVAQATGNAMFADLTSIAGRLYKHGDTQGLPDAVAHVRARISIHADEFNELIGDEFIPLVNKAGGAGVQVSAYTQTVSDIEAGIGKRAKAGQILGNFNTLIMLRVKNEETARVLTDQLPRVRVYTKIAESRTTDSVDPRSPVEFISQNADRLTEKETDLLSPADIVTLPKGQAFALVDGGRLHKLRLPLLTGEDPLLPADMDAIRAERAARYRESAA